MRKKLPIFYSALVLTGVNLLLRFVSTGFQVYLSARIGAAGIGLLQLVLSVGVLALTVGMAGIRTATMYLTASQLGRKRPENIRWVLTGCIQYSLVCSCIVSIILWALSEQVARLWIGEPAVASTVRLFALFLPINCLCGVLCGYFTAANRIGTLAAVEVAEQICSIALTLGLLMKVGDNAVRACRAVVTGSGLSSCVTLCALSILRWQEHSPSGPRLPMGRQLMQTAVPLAIADDFKSGISTTENLMVPKRLALFAGTADPLAEFGTVCGMVFPVLMFPAAILYALAELLIPELARCHAAGSQSRIRYLAYRSLRLAILYGCLFAGAQFLFSPQLCLALYQSDAAGYHLRHYALLIPMLYCDAVTDAMVKGLGQQTACVRYNIFTSTLDVIFLFLLLPRYGMAGYFFSFLVTHAINFILSLRRLLKLTGPVLSPAMPLLTLLGTAIAVWLAGMLEDIFLCGLVYVLTLGSLLVLFRIVGKEDLRWLRSLIQKK
ncbi:MAG: polysaccharide biosynthesis C-terminal domain-containing protein [Oscillospiraceae bacterium]|nr:polysaccharide biosynthesis C-terminal domain-containing protein [Oscillospiraceae bacterium]